MKYLYFLDGPVPTEEEAHEISEIRKSLTDGAVLQLRNSSLTFGDGVERCEGAFGSAPKGYTLKKLVQQADNGSGASDQNKPAVTDTPATTAGTGFPSGKPPVTTPPTSATPPATGAAKKAGWNNKQ